VTFFNKTTSTESYMITGRGTPFSNFLTITRTHFFLIKRKQKMIWMVGKEKLTMISAMTLGCLRGLKRNARNLVKATTKQIWRINRGSA